MNTSIKTFRQIVYMLIFFVIVALMQHSASAVDISWTNSLPVKVDADERIHIDTFECTRHQDYELRTINIADSEASATGCVVEGPIVNFGSYNHFQAVIKFTSEEEFHYIENLICATLPLCVYAPESDSLLTIDYAEGSASATKLVVYENFISRLRRVNHANGVSYELDKSNPDYLFQDINGVHIPVRSIDVSTNGEWAIAEVEGVGLFRINLLTHQIVKFSNFKFNRNYGVPRLEYDITDDGKNLAVMGINTDAVIYEITSACGLSIATPASRDIYLSESYKLCPLINLPAQQDLSIDNMRSGHLPKFSEDGGVLRYHAQSYDGRSYFTTLKAANYIMPVRLEYLALGDSYSSGEGDVSVQESGNKYYRNYTNIEEDRLVGAPREKCHVSSRSYPYILASEMNLGYATNSGITSRWQTVACSGAQMWDAKLSGSLKYRGQGKGLSKQWDSNGGVPRLEGYDVAGLKTQGLNEFIPGRQKQIEFVKKYQPRAITLTFGGNDVGFGGKIAACVMGILGNCKIASEEGKRDLQNEIMGKRRDLINFYTELRKVVKGTKIYVIGYPKIINPANDAVCQGDSIGMMNDQSREAIDFGYGYMNRTIEEAARSAGVKYIDVENAFDGKRLCDVGKERYVTGLAGLGVSEVQESFHPNAGGNVALAEAVNRQLVKDGIQHTLLSYPYEVSMGDEDAGADPTAVNVRTINALEGAVIRGNEVKVKIDDFTLRPQTSFDIKLYEEKTIINTVISSDKGGFDGLISVPKDVPAGLHTITIPSQSYSDHPIQLEQVIRVEGENPDDKDADGMKDNVDPCLFVTPANMDRDVDGIDDACDPEVGEPAVLYRARLGDIERTYAGDPEIASHIYIERNVTLAAKVGIIGDYDSDGDGWAVVAASRGIGYTTKSIPDTGPIANFIVNGDGSAAKPIVYVRTGSYGCVGYAPSNLKAVASDERRLLKRVALNTDKCRQAAPEADVDGDGIADNVQSLYLARQGNAARGEDSKKIYLFRNFHAAEAQMGVSDYSPTGTAAGRGEESIQVWNLLASSQNNTMPAFNTLMTVNGKRGEKRPIVLTKGQNGQCTAYEPTNTAIIKMTTQSRRGLNKLNKIPTGVNCL